MAHNPTQMLSYNKFNGDGKQGTLIANWYEERELQEATGTGRTKHQEHLPKNRTGLFTNPPDQLGKTHQIEDYDDTQERNLGKRHYEIPETHNSQYGRGQNPADKLPTDGKKAQMREKYFMQQINQELKEQENQEIQEANQRCFDTTNGTEFQQKDNSANTVGRRVMKTQDGKQLGLQSRDNDLLAETGQLDRQAFLTDEELRQQLPKGESYLTQQPITFWTEKQKDGAFYMSKGNDGKTTFNKNDEFCQTYTEYSHVKK